MEVRPKSKITSLGSIIYIEHFVKTIALSFATTLTAIVGPFWLLMLLIGRRGASDTKTNILLEFFKFMLKNDGLNLKILIIISVVAFLLYYSYKFHTRRFVFGASIINNILTIDYQQPFFKPQQVKTELDKIKFLNLDTKNNYIKIHIKVGQHSYRIKSNKYPWNYQDAKSLVHFGKSFQKEIPKSKYNYEKW